MTCLLWINSLPFFPLRTHAAQLWVSLAQFEIKMNSFLFLFSSVACNVLWHQNFLSPIFCLWGLFLSRLNCRSMVKIEVYKSAGKRNWQSFKWFVCRCTVLFGTLSVVVRLWNLKTKLHFPAIMMLSYFLGVLSMRFMDGCNLIPSHIADILVWKKLRRRPFNSQCLKTVPEV